MPKVFITQIPKKMNLSTGEMFPIIDLEPAIEFGTLTVMFDWMPNLIETKNVLERVQQKLKSYNFKDGDSIICTGDPMAFAFSCAYLGAKFGIFNYLKWNKSARKYKKVTVDVR